MYFVYPRNLKWLFYLKAFLRKQFSFSDCIILTSIVLYLFMLWHCNYEISDWENPTLFSFWKITFNVQNLSVSSRGYSGKALYHFFYQLPQIMYTSILISDIRLVSLRALCCSRFYPRFEIILLYVTLSKVAQKVELQMHWARKGSLVVFSSMQNLNKTFDECLQ